MSGTCAQSRIAPVTTPTATTGTWKRDAFPVLATCVYLNSNSVGAVPAGCQAVLADYWQGMTAWRDEIWTAWWQETQAFADGLAALIGAVPNSVVTDVNLSSLFGRLTSTLTYEAPRRKVVITDLEFPTIGFIGHRLQRLGAELCVVRSRDGVAIDVDELCAAIDENTRLVCVSHASFTTGALIDLAAVTQRAHAVGALVVVDAYQSVGVVPIDVTDLGVDFLLGGTRKWLCGALDLAFLYARPDVCATLEPVATGWMAAADPFALASMPLTPAAPPLSAAFTAAYAADARRFSSGTPALLPALFSRVGLDIIADIGVPAIRAASLARTAQVIERADALGIEVATPRSPAQRGGIVCLRLPDPAGVAAELNRRGFVCSHRHGIRVAPHFYNTDEDVAAFMDELGTLVSKKKP